MIMMRPTPSTKMAKPPPPVPPRPSKSLVAEALAKTRKTQSPENLNQKAPVRTAPPPPACDVNKSKSAVSINVMLQKNPTPSLERSISSDVKCSTRTVIFQSPKIEKKVEAEKKIDTNIEVVTNNGNTTKENGNDIISENDTNKKWDEILNDRNHVNTLIDEMFASVLEVSTLEDDQSSKITINSTKVETSDNNNPVTVVVVDDNNKNSSDNPMITSIPTSNSNSSSNCSTGEKKKVQFDDRMNHELLISELESMRIEDEKILKRQRKPSRDIYDSDNNSDVSNKIQHSDWVEVSDGQEVRLSSCQITIDDLKNEEIGGEKLKLDYERINTMSSLNGLPPLPKSLSGFNLDGQKPPTPVRTTSMRSGQAGGHAGYPSHTKSGEASGRKSTNLDTQLAILRREMYSLRQLDLSLLSQLWSLNESIQDFRQILQDQEDRMLSPPSPSPASSSEDEDEGDDFYTSTSSMNFRTPPPPPPARRPSSSSNASSLG